MISALAQGAAGSFMFSDRGPRMLQAYTGGAEVKSRVDIFVKDMGIVTSVGRACHVPLPLAAAANSCISSPRQPGSVPRTTRVWSPSCRQTSARTQVKTTNVS